LCPARGNHHSAPVGFYVAVARVVAEIPDGVLDDGEALAAFGGVLPVRSGGCEGYEREQREEG